MSVLSVSTTCEPELDVSVPLPIRADAWDCVAVDGVIATEAIEAGVGTLPRVLKPPRLDLDGGGWRAEFSTSVRMSVRSWSIENSAPPCPGYLILGQAELRE